MDTNKFDFKFSKTKCVPELQFCNFEFKRLQFNCDGSRWRREGKWKGNWWMQWVASTLHTTSEHVVSSITTADAHTLAASSRLNWRPRRFKWTRPFHRKTKSGFCACVITFQLASNTTVYISWYEEWIWNIPISSHASKVTFRRNAVPSTALFLWITNQKILWCNLSDISRFHSVQFHRGFHRTCPYVRVIRKVITDHKASHLVSTVNRGSGNWRRNIHTNFRYELQISLTRH